MTGVPSHFTGWPTFHQLVVRGLLGLALVALVAVPSSRGADIEAAPINYSTAPDDNPVARLQKRIDAGEVKLLYEEHYGYLRSLLRELHVPVSSQVLVFSKTSLQRQRIAPRTPRALYFNDDVYLGFCQEGELMEVTAIDPKLGAVYYSVEQRPVARPRFVRQNDTCLICHASSQNQGLPGNLIRSVYPDALGLPILSAGTYRIDQSSSLKQRWGGWYVTGTSGKQVHMGNAVVRNRHHPEELETGPGRNITDLKKRFDTSAYVSPHSDIVALMVLEHQAEAHNLITRANLLTRVALHEEAALNQALGRPANYRSESTKSRIQNAGEPLVKYLLMSGEVALTDRVRGTSGFAQEFVQRGPRDHRGRSLRDLELTRRLFAYPCSYEIYSAAFDALPAPVKDYVLRRMWEVLTGKDTSEDFKHLSGTDRRAIREILLETKSDLPVCWKASAGGG
jgi:hypothetical protein